MPINRDQQLASVLMDHHSLCNKWLDNYWESLDSYRPQPINFITTEMTRVSKELVQRDIQLLKQWNQVLPLRQQVIWDYRKEVKPMDLLTTRPLVEEYFLISGYQKVKIHWQNLNLIPNSYHQLRKYCEKGKTLEDKLITVLMHN